MPRNDGVLYSGLTAPIRRQKIEDDQTAPKPDAKAELVLEELAKLKAEAMDITKIVLDDSLDDTTKLRTLERMRERFNDLVTLERRMQKLLGIKQTRGKA